MACKPLTTLLFVLVAGCASQSAIQQPANPPTAAVRPAEPERVKGCEYLDDVIGSSGLYGAFASKGIENARAETADKAARLGATHIVWQGSNTGYGSTSVVAKAYRCPS